MIEVLAFVCVSHVTSSRTVRKTSKRDTSHKLTSARNFRELWEWIDIIGSDRGLIAIHLGVICLRFRRRPVVSWTQVLHELRWGCSLCSDMLHDHFEFDSQVHHF